MRETVISAMLGVAILLLLSWLIWVLFPHPGWAHAFYDIECCSGQDCAPVRADRVTAVKGGWRVQLSPGDHPLVFREIDQIVPYNAAKVRQSPDGAFHVCVGAMANTLYCIYVPELGS